MRVGVNYPWVDYGWDFGVAPPSWRGHDDDPRWMSVIDEDLRRFQALGVTVLRWFILADGLTYGSGTGAPWLDPLTGRWHFAAPRLSAEALGHFETLLLRIEAANQSGAEPLQLLPVLIDFHFCEAGAMPVTVDNAVDPDWVKGGRAEAIAEAANRQRFFDGVLDPLLRVSQAHAGAIIAWELINEPEWITSGWHPDGQSAHPVDAAAMTSFLTEGKSRIRQFAIKPTIGFAMIDTLRRTGITAEINQFHHYPNGARALERHVFDPRAPGIVGEFATAATDRWPELPRDRQTVLDRLQIASSRGYPLAVPWSYRGVDRHTAWTAEVERDLMAFAGRQARRPAAMPVDLPEASLGDVRAVGTPSQSRCAAETSSGTRCRRRPVAGSTRCWQHQPDHRAVRISRRRR